MHVVSAQCHCQSLRLLVVVEELIVLVIEMEHSVFVKLGDVSKLLLHLARHGSSSLQCLVWELLKLILLVTEAVLPLVEGIGKISLDMLLTVLDETEPVSDNLPHVDILAPSLKHLRLQVAILMLGVDLPSSDCFLQDLISSLLTLIRNIVNLPVSESFILHKVFEVEDIHLGIQDLFNDWAFFIDFNECLSHSGLILPAVESESEILVDPVTKDNSSLALNLPDLEHLVSVVVQVGEEHPIEILLHDARKTRRSNSLSLAVEIKLGKGKVLDCLESCLQHSIIELCCSVGKSEHQSLLSVVLKHEFSVDCSLINELSLLFKLIHGTSCLYCGLSSTLPFHDHSLCSV